MIGLPQRFTRSPYTARFRSAVVGHQAGRAGVIDRVHGKDVGAVGVGVVSEHVHGDGRAVLVGVCGVVDGHRSVVLAGDRDGHLRGVGPAVAVGHGVVEDIGGGLALGEVLEGAVGVVGDVGAV